MQNLFTQNDSYLISASTKLAPQQISQREWIDVWNELQVSCPVQLKTERKEVVWHTAYCQNHPEASSHYCILIQMLVLGFSSNGDEISI